MQVNPGLEKIKFDTIPIAVWTRKYYPVRTGHQF